MIFDEIDEISEYISMPSGEKHLCHPLAFLTRLTDNKEALLMRSDEAMGAMIRSCTVFGLEGVGTDIKVALASGPVSVTISGLADAFVNEAKERVMGAIPQSSCFFPRQQIMVNLTPAQHVQAGHLLALPIALAILLASGQLNADARVHSSLFLGELAADGSIHHQHGILPLVAWGREQQLHAVFVPAVDVAEAALVEGVNVYPVETLRQLVAHLNGEAPLEPSRSFAGTTSAPSLPDISAVRGQEHVKRALEVAASGGHHLVLSGAPLISLRVCFGKISCS